MKMSFKNHFRNRSGADESDGPPHPDRGDLRLVGGLTGVPDGVVAGSHQGTGVDAGRVQGDSGDLRGGKDRTQLAEVRVTE